MRIYKYLAKGSRFKNHAIEVFKFHKSRLLARDLDTGEIFIGLSRPIRKMSQERLNQYYQNQRLARFLEETRQRHTSLIFTVPNLEAWKK